MRCEERFSHDMWTWHFACRADAAGGAAMTSFHLIVVSVLLLVSPLIAVAAPGDPRLVNGVLEWPRAVTNETFVLVRGEDGVLYHIGVAAARREAAVVAGARVSVLGIEGRSPHEITAFALASGPTADAALAQL